MRKVKTHKFNGIKYHVDLDIPYDGWCDKPGTPDPKEYPAIRLPNGLPFGNRKGAKYGLLCLLHECLHAENWSKSEKEVDRVAVDIGNLLWRLGFRRAKEK